MMIDIVIVLIIKGNWNGVRNRFSMWFFWCGGGWLVGCVLV